MGDVILATPVVEKLHRFYPDSRIDMLVRKGNEGLLENHPRIDRLWVWDKKRAKYKNLRMLIRAIRKARYDHVINLQRFGASGLMTVMSGAKEKVGFEKNPFSFGFHRKFEHAIGQKGDAGYFHETGRNLQLIEHLTDSSSERPRLYPTEKDFEKVKAYQRAPFVTLAPTSVWFTKQWPPEKWQELLEQLKDFKVYLLGGPPDFDACEGIKKYTSHPDVTNLAGKLSLLQSAALMAEARMNYVNDSAPMHIASSMNAPVTAIYCSTVPEFGFGPLSDESHVVESKVDLACRPCGLHGYRKCPEGHFKCALTIDKEQIPIPTKRS